MDYESLIGWFITASVIALLLIKKAKSRDVSFSADDVPGEFETQMHSPESCADAYSILRDRLLGQGYRIQDEKDGKIVFDSAKSGFFHWGFLYTVSFEEHEAGCLVTAAIHGKGPNPPKGEALLKHHGNFLNNVAGILRADYLDKVNQKN